MLSIKDKLRGVPERIAKRKEEKDHTVHWWQHKDNHYSIPNIIKRYKIHHPQDLRLYALAKKKYPYIETDVKSLEESLVKQGKKLEECAGILISKLFPKV